MSKCKKIDEVDGVVAKVKVTKDGERYGEFSFMLEGESLARIRLAESQMRQFRELLNRMFKAIDKDPEQQEYKIV